MDQVNKLDDKMYIENLEALVTARTEQLRAAVTTIEEMHKLIRGAAPALRNVDDLAVQTLLAKFGQ